MIEAAEGRWLEHPAGGARLLNRLRGEISKPSTNEDVRLPELPNWGGSLVHQLADEHSPDLISFDIPVSWLLV